MRYRRLLNVGGQSHITSNGLTFDQLEYLTRTDGPLVLPCPVVHPQSIVREQLGELLGLVLAINQCLDLE